MPKAFLENRPSFRNLVNKENLVGVEIGVDLGVNAENILKTLDIKRLYLIDPWEHYGDMSGRGVYYPDDEVGEIAARERMQLYKDKVTIIRALSEDAVDLVEDDLDFVYIDGNHRFEYVKNDIDLYYPKIKVGGMLAGHDFKSGEKGVVKAVREAFDNDFENKNQDWWKIKHARES